MRPTPKTAGYSLVELMVVVALVGIISALATPSLVAGIHSANMTASMRRLYAMFIEAQALAKARGHACCFVVDLGARTYKITEDTNGDGACEADIAGKSSALTPSYVGFKPDGYPQAFPVPYDQIPRNTGCTACAGSPCTLRFDSTGAVEDLSALGGSITLYDASGKSSHVEALVFVGRTGAVRLYRLK
jgi:prepilin-type N-terminal cleavage/methylation domain-containing protein